MVNIYVLVFVVPKFGQIYADALPGRPLPFLTETILAWRLAIILINVAWLVICGYLAHRRSHRSILLINLATFCNFVQVGITFAALVMPMVVTITGMSQVACS